MDFSIEVWVTVFRFDGVTLDDAGIMNRVYFEGVVFDDGHFQACRGSARLFGNIDTGSFRATVHRGIQPSQAT